MQNKPASLLEGVNINLNSYSYLYIKGQYNFLSTTTFHTFDALFTIKVLKNKNVTLRSLFINIIDNIIGPFLQIQCIHVYWKSLNIKLYGQGQNKPFFAKLPLPRIHGLIDKSEASNKPLIFRLQYLYSHKTCTLKLYGVATLFFNIKDTERDLQQKITRCERIFLQPINLNLIGTKLKYIKSVRKPKPEIIPQIPIMVTA